MLRALTVHDRFQSTSLSITVPSASSISSDASSWKALFIKFVVVHGLFLYPGLALNQKVDHGLAVDQSDRSVNGISASLS